MNRLRWILLGSMLLFPFTIAAQQFAVKTNILYDATTTPNLGVEVGLGKKFTLDVSGNCNPWNSIAEGRSLKHWMAQPEFRYWPVERFNGHFIGVHAYYLDYVFKDVKLPIGIERDQGFDGTGYGVGISYGYQLYLGPRWNAEFTAGFGYGYYKYDKFSLIEGANEYLGLFKSNYWGITKVGITIVYLLK